MFTTVGEDLDHHSFGFFGLLILRQVGRGCETRYSAMNVFGSYWKFVCLKQLIH